MSLTLSVLGLPTRAAQLRLDLLFKIDTELPREDRGCDHDIGQLGADIVVGAEGQALTHGSPQGPDALAGTLDQPQRAIGQAVLAIPLTQPSASAMIRGSVATIAKSGSGSPPRMVKR